MMAIRTGLKVFAISAITLLCLSSLAPIVAAKGPRSGETREEEVVLSVRADEALDWTIEMNVANASEHCYTDYNLSWIPFFENNTDISGIVVHSPLTSPLFSLNVSDPTISTGSYFRLTAEQIMDGSSEVWFRLPVTNIPTNATIRSTIVKVSNPMTFNMSWAGYGDPVFDYPRNVQLVHEIVLDPEAETVIEKTNWTIPDAWLNYKRWQNVSFEAEEETYWYNWTYIKNCFMLFPNEWYFVQFDIYAPYAEGMALAISLSDFGDDERYNTWFWLEGTSYWLPADLDTAMVLTYGVSNGITGIGTTDTYSGGSGTCKWNFNASIPIRRTVNATIAPWFEIVVPMMMNGTVTDYWMGMTIAVSFYSSEDDSDCILVEEWDPGAPLPVYGTFTFYVKDVNVTTIDDEYIDHVRCNFITPKTDSTQLKFWGTQIATNYTSKVGFTDIYYTNESASDPVRTYRCVEKQWVVPFGVYTLSNTTWNMTNYSIILIPVLTPDTPLEVYEAYQAFMVYLDSERMTLSERFQKSLFADLCAWTAKTLIEFWLDVGRWAYEHLPFLRWIIDALVGIGEFIVGIGVAFWDLVTVLVDYLEWVTYWAVRVIYSFSIAIVYMVNVFGVISINSALFAVCRTGNGRDFLRSFRLGWKFVLAIMTLLLSLGILAVSIVGAVVPF